MSKAKKTPPDAETPGVPGVPGWMATVGPADLPHLPAGQRGRTAFVPNPYPEKAADPRLRFTLFQAAKVAPAVSAVETCRLALVGDHVRGGLPELKAPQYAQTDGKADDDEGAYLPPALADAFARLVVEIDRVLYLAGRRS